MTLKSPTSICSSKTFFALANAVRGRKKRDKGNEEERGKERGKGKRRAPKGWVHGAPGVKPALRTSRD
jgi:hypothetical protein